MSTLTIAIICSVLVHGAVLAVRFTMPDMTKNSLADPGLEVILVNAKHSRPPLRPDALAQANLDGGGQAEAGRARSPLLDTKKIEDGNDVLLAKRKVADLEEQQNFLLAELKKDILFKIPEPKEKNQVKEISNQPDGTDSLTSIQAIARREAEIAKNIEDYNKRPKKTQISPSTRAVGYAMYYKSLQERIEKIGTLNFPQQDGVKLYGELILSIPIFQDGSIYEKEGGIKVEQSSHNTALDTAAMNIVRRAAPFGRFPSGVRSGGRDEVWEVVTRFRFTRDNGLEAEQIGAR